MSKRIIPENIAQNSMKEQGFFPDNAVDYGNGVIGPSTADQESFNNPQKKPLEDLKGKSSLHFGEITGRSAVAGVVAFVGAGTATVINPEETKASQNPNYDQTQEDNITNTENSTEATLTELKFDRPFPPDQTMYLTGGPHHYKTIPGGITTEVRSSLDFAPETVTSCVNNENLVLDEYKVTAPRNGKVISLSKGLMELSHGKGLSSFIVHIGNEQVDLGEKVKRGQVLGFMSCISPEDGYSSGVQIDFSVRKKGEDGIRRSIPATQVNWSDGSRAFESPLNYDGGLIMDNEIITADTRRCGPDQASIDNCGGIKNAIVSVPNDDINPSINTSQENLPSFSDLDFGEEEALPDFEPADETEQIRYDFLKDIFNSIGEKQNYEHDVNAYTIRGRTARFLLKGSSEGKFDLSRNEKEEIIRALARGEILSLGDNPIKYSWEVVRVREREKNGKKNWAQKYVGTVFFDDLRIVEVESTTELDRKNGIAWKGDLQLQFTWRSGSYIDEIYGCDNNWLNCNENKANRIINRFLENTDHSRIQQRPSNWGINTMRADEAFLFDDGSTKINTLELPEYREYDSFISLVHWMKDKKGARDVIREGMEIVGEE